MHRPKYQCEWADSIPADNWVSYRSAMEALRAAGVPFMLGGGFALATYVGRWRNTKDIDFYIYKQHRQAAIDALAEAGFEDYFSQLPYDRKWIYRSTRSGVIVDIIWAMANQRAQVDEFWFERAPQITLRGESLRIVPIEEFIWCKLYIVQRDHCDWTDVLNVLYAAAKQIDWEYLLWRLDTDRPLLRALITLYGWVCPRRARELPYSLRRRLSLRAPQPLARGQPNRIRLLDTRNWFAALLEPDQPLEV